jgi:hypothetical protein
MLRGVTMASDGQHVYANDTMKRAVLVTGR